MTDQDYLLPESLLTLDIGASMTRAALFDIHQDHYRYLGTGMAPTTAAPPSSEIRRGIRWALEELTAVTGRDFIDSNGRLLQARAQPGVGIDAISATYSITPPLKVLAIGLTPDGSLASVCRLARSIRFDSLETLSLEDKRTADAQLDEILRARPDLILMAGGSDGGASEVILGLADMLALACALLPIDARPAVFYAGNQSLQPAIKSRLERLVHLVCAPNICPQAGLEQLAPAVYLLGKLHHEFCQQQFPWLARLDELSEGKLISAPAAFSRLVHFLNHVHPSEKGVLGIDLGASALTVASSFRSVPSVQIYPEYGMGCTLGVETLQNLGNKLALWLSIPLQQSFIQEYLLNKSLYPESIPTTPETLAIEQALARVLLQLAIQQSRAGFALQASSVTPGMLPAVEPILATGAVIARAPDLASSLLMLLDGLQPTGITTLVLDNNLIAPALGAAAAAHPEKVVQLLTSDVFLHLATVITPVGKARPGTPILRGKISLDDGQESSLEIVQGALQVVPIPAGKTARLQLTPLQRFDIGMGAPGIGGSLRVAASAFGLVIDARGRPLPVISDAARRQALHASWLAAVQK